MNLSQDQFGSTNPQPQIPGQSHAPAPVGQEESASLSNLCPTADKHASDPTQLRLWSQDDKPRAEGLAAHDSPLQPDSHPVESADVTPHEDATRHSTVSRRLQTIGTKRKGRDEDVIRHWVQKAISDPTPGCIRHYYFGYRASVFQATATATATATASDEDDGALSYSAFCRRAAAIKEHRSAVRRVRFNAEYRPLPGAARQSEGYEALWIQSLPAQRAAPWDPSPTPDKPATVCIAVDAITGAVRVDSQFVGTYPSDEVAVSAVKHYELQHGRAPHTVCVDGADFHHAPAVTRLCRQLGIELRIVHARRSQHATRRRGTVSPLRLWNGTIDKAGPTVVGKTAVLSKLHQLHVDGLQNALRDSLRDISLASTARGRLRDLHNPRSLRSIWPRKADDRASGEETAQ